MIGIKGAGFRQFVAPVAIDAILVTIGKGIN
jgi:hypothetical protein